MGTPIRFEDISRTYDLAVVSKMSSRISRELGHTVLQEYTRHAKYVAGYSVFGDYLLEQRTLENTDRETVHDLFRRKVYDLPEGFDGNSRCFPIIVSAYKQWFDTRDYEYVYRQEMLITTGGELLVWDWFALCLERRGRPTEFAINSKVRFIRGRSLEKWLSRPQITLSMLAAFRTIIDGTISERRKRLKSMEDLACRLSGINRHLIFD